MLRRYRIYNGLFHCAVVAWFYILFSFYYGTMARRFVPIPMCTLTNPGSIHGVIDYRLLHHTCIYNINIFFLLVTDVHNTNQSSFLLVTDACNIIEDHHSATDILLSSSAAFICRNITVQSRKISFDLDIFGCQKEYLSSVFENQQLPFFCIRLDLLVRLVT